MIKSIVSLVIDINVIVVETIDHPLDRIINNHFLTETILDPVLEKDLKDVHGEIMILELIVIRIDQVLKEAGHMILSGHSRPVIVIDLDPLHLIVMHFVDLLHLITIDSISIDPHVDLHRVHVESIESDLYLHLVVVIHLTKENRGLLIKIFIGETRIGRGEGPPLDQVCIGATR